MASTYDPAACWRQNRNAFTLNWRSPTGLVPFPSASLVATDSTFLIAATTRGLCQPAEPCVRESASYDTDVEDLRIRPPHPSRPG